MTPRASEIYFKLLDSKMEKLASVPASPGFFRRLFSPGTPLFDWNKVRDFGNFAPKNTGAVVADAVETAAPKAESSGYGLGTLLGAAGITGIGAGAIGHAIAKQNAEEQARADKLKSFGAGFGGGVATGLAAPSIMGGVNRAVGKLNRIVGNQGFMPSDTYGAYAPELGFYPEQY